MSRPGIEGKNRHRSVPSAMFRRDRPMRVSLLQPRQRNDSSIANRRTLCPRPSTPPDVSILFGETVPGRVIGLVVGDDMAR